MSGDARCIWLTREQRDWLAHYSALAGVYDVFGVLTDAYDAAAESPDEAIARALNEAIISRDPKEGLPVFRHRCGLAVLRELGYPDA